MQTIDITQAQQHFSELIEKAINGDEVLITKAGRPVVKFVAVKTVTKQRLFGSAKGLIKIADDFDEPLNDFKEYM